MIVTYRPGSSDEAQPPPLRKSLPRRTAAAALRRVDAMFSRNGPAFRRLALSWAGNVAGDTLVAIALAGTLFFDVPSAEARDKVLLYLGLTFAPFAVVAPLLGSIFNRFPVYRATLTTSSTLRAVLAVIMMMGLTNLWLFPLAFGVLVLSRLYGISKSSLLPVALPQPVALVSANAYLARIGIFAGALAVPFGAAAAQMPRMKGAAALVLAAAAYAFSAMTSTRLPNARELKDVTGSDAALADPLQARRRHGHRRRRSLRISRYATAGVRLLNGFLLALLAFEFRDANAGFLDFGALIAAAGFGFGLASFVSPFLERRLREEPMVVAALAIEAAAAFIAGQFFGLGAAAALVAAAGLAWGTAKFAFDGLLQQVVDPSKRGSAFTRSETLFQLAWVIGAIVPVAIPIAAEIGLAMAGVTALAAQTLFVSSLLVGFEERDRGEGPPSRQPDEGFRDWVGRPPRRP